MRMPLNDSTRFLYNPSVPDLDSLRGYRQQWLEDIRFTPLDFPTITAPTMNGATPNTKKSLTENQKLQQQVDNLINTGTTELRLYTYQNKLYVYKRGQRGLCCFNINGSVLGATSELPHLHKSLRALAKREGVKFEVLDVVGVNNINLANIVYYWTWKNLVEIDDSDLVTIIYPVTEGTTAYSTDWPFLEDIVL